MGRYDVVIVGAGPAGSALAIVLARDGYRVLLIEKDRFPRDKVCGDFVSPKGLRLLRDLGCLAAIEERGFIPIRKSSVYLNGQKISEGHLPRLPGQPAHGHAIPRAELDEIMFRRAQAAGAETLEGRRVVDFAIEPDSVRVQALSDDTVQTITGTMIVGADGAQSTVARASGQRTKDPRYVLASIRTYCEGLPLDETILSFDEEFFPGFGWIFPITDRLSNIGVGMVAEPLKKHNLSLRQFFAHTERLAATLAEASGSQVKVGRTVGWPIKTYGGAHRNYFERGLLIGEAACFVDPISGEGIPLAMESAELAAATIRDAFLTSDFSANGLATYETRWRNRYDPDLKVSDLIVSMVRNRHLVKLWMKSFEVMSRTALHDESYAAKTGGILAGLVPNRMAFSPDVIVKSLVHGPSFWMDTFDISPASALADLMRRTLDLAHWESATLHRALQDRDWFRLWWDEVNEKQMMVAATLFGDALNRPPDARSGGIGDGGVRLYPLDTIRDA